MKTFGKLLQIFNRETPGKWHFLSNHATTKTWKLMKNDTENTWSGDLLEEWRPYKSAWKCNFRFWGPGSQRSLPMLFSLCRYYMKRGNSVGKLKTYYNKLTCWKLLEFPTYFIKFCNIFGSGIVRQQFFIFDISANEHLRPVNNSGKLRHHACLAAKKIIVATMKLFH